METWSLGRAARPARAEEDVDLDTRPGKWETYDETGDGRPDRRLVYAAGALVAIESDPGEDGAYRTRIEVGR